MDDLQALVEELSKPRNETFDHDTYAEYWRGYEAAVAHIRGKLAALLAQRAPARFVDGAGFVGGTLYCHGGCGRRYEDFGLDTILPTPLWNRIAPRPPDPGDEKEGGGGVLCASCMVERIGKLPDSPTALFMTPEREAQPAPSPWQPIATAPKDGTLLVLYRPKLRSWERVAVRKANDWCGPMCCPGAEPTHWMPLPSPPTTETP